MVNPLLFDSQPNTWYFADIFFNEYVCAQINEWQLSENIQAWGGGMQRIDQMSYSAYQYASIKHQPSDQHCVRITQFKRTGGGNIHFNQTSAIKPSRCVEHRENVFSCTWVPRLAV